MATTDGSTANLTIPEIGIIIRITTGEKGTGDTTICV